MKERLTGAIILVALIVLLVPELLSGPKPRSVSAPPAGSATGASEEPPLRSYTINLGEDSHSRTATAGTNGPQMPQPESSGGNPEKRQGRDAGQPESSGGNPEKRQGRDAGQPESSGGNPEKRQGRDAGQPRPEQPSLPASEGDPQQPASQPNTPEQSGPAAFSSQGSSPPARSQEQAASPKPALPRESKPASARLPEPKPAKAPSHSKPVIAPKPATAPKTAGSTVASNSAAAKPNKAPPAKPESGWAVQLGVFSSHENAERLATDVRVKGFKVSVSPITSGGRKLYRVRVGPAADRAAAQDLQARLKAAGRPAGTVVPYS